MTKKKTQEQILKEYEEKSEEILQKMMRVLIRVQRKVDDKAYRSVLEKMEKIKKQETA